MTQQPSITVADRALARLLVWTVLIAVAVYATVGLAAAVLIAVAILTDRVVLPGRHVLATLACLALVAVPVLWVTGSSLPLTPPAPRIAANTLAHHVGGLAVWLLFVAAWAGLTPSATQVELGLTDSTGTDLGSAGTPRTMTKEAE